MIFARWSTKWEMLPIEGRIRRRAYAGQGPRQNPGASGMVGTARGDMIGRSALAIEMGADAVDIGETIPPASSPGESIGM